MHLHCIFFLKFCWFILLLKIINKNLTLITYFRTPFIQHLKSLALNHSLHVVGNGGTFISRQTEPKFCTMNQRLQNQRRSSITVDRPYTVLFPSTTSIPPNLETNDFDDYMDSSDSLTSISSEPAQPDRPVTRSFTKMQNAQLNSVTPRTLTTQAISSSLRSLETQLHQTVRGSKINSKSLKPPPPPQTYQKIQIDEKSVNLVSILEKSMLTGKRPNSMTTVSYLLKLTKFLFNSCNNCYLLI